jgi:diguanylate cyclase (GGDEF)-like protein/PAS domain S-box-containing protein
MISKVESMNLFSNLRVRLITFFLLAITPLLILILYSGLQHRSRAFFDARQEVSAQVNEISETQHRFISNALQLLFTLAHLSQFKELDSLACSTILADLLKESEGYTVFLAATPEGDVFASAPAFDQPITVSDHPYFVDPVKPGDFIVGNYQIKLLSGKPTLFITHPVVGSEHHPNAILIAGLGMVWLSQIIDLAGFSSDTVVTIFDRKGTILFHHPDPEKVVGKSIPDSTLVKTILQNGEGVIEMDGLDNVKRIYGFRALGNTSSGFYVSLGIPSQIVLAEANRKMIRSLIWVGLVALSVFTATCFLGNSITKPFVNPLLRVTRQLAQGDFTARTGISHGSGSLGKLALAFDRMADSLRWREEERRRTEEALLESEEHYRRIVETVDQGIWMVNAEHTTIFINKKVVQMLGYTRDEMRGRSFLEFTDAQGRALIESSRHGCPEGSCRHYDLRLRRKDGGDLWTIVSASPFFDKTGEYNGTLITITDITERKKAEEELKYMSLHDPLTGLYNRAYFEDGMRRLEDNRFSPAGIIICDVDGLKFINDTLGHKAGDSILVATAGIIKECFRGSDVVARVGGDEFAIMLPNTKKAVVENACSRLKHAISNYNVSHFGLPMSLSIGFAIDRKKSIHMKGLYKEADSNMYKEKLHNRQNTHRSIVSNLLRALEKKDHMTEGHMVRLKGIIKTFASAIDMPRRLVKDLLLFAQFHDIGKVCIPDSILFKPERLSFEEYTEIKRHCEIGYRIAQFSPGLTSIADSILKHHEWWNGKGYPLGLKGHDIPLECRILAITDAYDSMTSSRPYREPVSHKEAIRELKKCAGTQFNPELVEKFIQAMTSQTAGSIRRG